MDYGSCLRGDESPAGKCRLPHELEDVDESFLHRRESPFLFSPSRSNLL